MLRMEALLEHFTVHKFNKLDSIDTKGGVIFTLLKEQEGYLIISDRFGYRCYRADLYIALNDFIAYNQHTGGTVALDCSPYWKGDSGTYGLYTVDEDPIYHIIGAWWCPIKTHSEYKKHYMPLSQALHLVEQSQVCELCLDGERPFFENKEYKSCLSHDLRYLHNLWSRSWTLFAAQ